MGKVAGINDEITTHKGCLNSTKYPVMWGMGGTPDLRQLAWRLFFD
jgi:hypothetical protein